MDMSITGWEGREIEGDVEVAWRFKRGHTRHLTVVCWEIEEARKSGQPWESRQSQESWLGMGVCLLAGDVTAEETGLDPVDSDENTVAG